MIAERGWPSRPPPFASSHPTGATCLPLLLEIPVQPIGVVPNELCTGHEVPALVHDPSLALLRRAERLEHGPLRRLPWQDVVVLAVQHQHGIGDTTQEVERLDLRLAPQNWTNLVHITSCAIGGRRPVSMLD